MTMNDKKEMLPDDYEQTFMSEIPEDLNHSELYKSDFEPEVTERLTHKANGATEYEKQLEVYNKQEVEKNDTIIASHTLGPWERIEKLKAMCVQ